MVVGTADRGAGAPTHPLRRTRPRIRPPAPLLSSIRGPVRRNDILALEDFPRQGHECSSHARSGRPSVVILFPITRAVIDHSPSSKVSPRAGTLSN
jgi:hypothetical protein